VPCDYFDVGRLQLRFDSAGAVLGLEWALEPVTSDLPQDRFILRNVEEPVTAFVAELAETVIATSEVGLNGVRDDVRTRETNLGNLLADAHMAAAQARAAEFGVPEAQVALQNGGGIRNDSVIPAGDITLLDTFDIAPFTNFVSVLTVSSADFVAAVGHGLAGLPGAAGSFGQWAGLTVEYDVGAAVGSRVVNLTLDDGTVVVQDGATRVHRGRHGRDDRLPRHGSGRLRHVRGLRLHHTGHLVPAVAGHFIEGLGTITAADYSDPENEADRGRIIPVN
jgi:5'-nucleotidase / UDP-sugar diphosphatase